MMGIGLIFYLFLLGISLLIFYLIIKAAIDNSQVAQLLREIRNSLNGIRQQVGNLSSINADFRESPAVSGPESVKAGDRGQGAPLNDKCPGCGGDVDSVNDIECKKCGLRLK